MQGVEQFWLSGGDRVRAWRPDGTLYLDTVLTNRSPTWLLIGNETLLRRWGVYHDDHDGR